MEKSKCFWFIGRLSSAQAGARGWVNALPSRWSGKVGRPGAACVLGSQDPFNPDRISASTLHSTRNDPSATSEGCLGPESLPHGLAHSATPRSLRTNRLSLIPNFANKPISGSPCFVAMPACQPRSCRLDSPTAQEQASDASAQVRMSSSQAFPGRFAASNPKLLPIRHQ